MFLTVNDLVGTDSYIIFCSALSFYLDCLFHFCVFLDVDGLYFPGKLFVACDLDLVAVCLFLLDQRRDTFFLESETAF